MNNIADVLIVGTGCAGLYCALNLPSDTDIMMITKAAADENDSHLAQGGMCMLRCAEDYDSYFEDTMKAGHYENDRTSVDIMIRTSPQVVEQLVGYGVDFEREEDGSFKFTREGAHSEKRILYHEDITGKEITSKLLEAARSKQNINIYEHSTLVDIIEKDGKCTGAVVYTAEGIKTISCKVLVLATGGLGGLYRHSTNFRHLTADGLAIALKHGIRTKDINYIQIHPTTLYSEKPEDRSFLISESVRGEGAKLYNKAGERFAPELLPRDLLTQKIREQMKIDDSDFVWEDLRPIPRDELLSHFPNIVEHCRENGYDVEKECIPVVPAQHYYMGGIWVDHQSHTSMDGLYAVGETACNGVHGRNRLASNSLLESLVFAGRAAEDMLKYLDKNDAADSDNTINIDLELYSDIEKIFADYRELVLSEIKAADEKGE